MATNAGVSKSRRIWQSRNTWGFRRISFWARDILAGRFSGPFPRGTVSYHSDHSQTDVSPYLAMFRLRKKKIRPESVSDQRRTYPFPNPVTVNWQHVRVNLGLGRGRYAVARKLTLINKYILIKMLWSVRLIHHCLCKIMFLIYNWLSKEIRNGAFRDLTKWSNLQGNFSLVVCQFHNFPSFQLFFWKSKHLICVFICTS